jgi:predicted DNA-binding protein
MDEKRLEELATHYDNQDISEEIATKPLERHEPADQVMIVSSIRLPKPTMDRVRDVAAAEGVKPTALMRQWIEEQLNRLEDRTSPVDQLESLSLLIHRAVREELEEAGLRSA